MTKMFGSSDFCPVPVSKIIQFLSISARRADCTISAMEEVWINIRKLVLSWISAMEEVWITRLQRNAGLDRQEATRQKSSGEICHTNLIILPKACFYLYGTTDRRTSHIRISPKHTEYQGREN